MVKMMNMMGVYTFNKTVYFTPDDDSTLLWDGSIRSTTDCDRLIIDRIWIIADVTCAHFHRCEIAYLASFLQNNRNITHLKLTDCIFRDKFSLDQVCTITRLDVHDMTIDLDAIPPEVIHLTLENGFGLGSIDFMRSNTSIQYLRLWNTGVRSLEPLRDNTTITSLDISHSLIESFEPLRFNRTITSLYVAHLPSITDLSPIWGNTSIISGAIDYTSSNTQLQVRALVKSFNFNTLNSELRRMTLRRLSKTHI